MSEIVIKQSGDSAEQSQAVLNSIQEFQMAFRDLRGEKIELVNPKVRADSIDFDVKYADELRAELLAEYVNSCMVIAPAISKHLYSQVLEKYGIPQEAKIYNFYANVVDGRLHVVLSLHGLPFRIRV